MNINYNQKLLFFVLFISLGLVALQVPLVPLAGSRAQLTVFDAFGPLASGFIGTIPGVVAVFLMQLINFLLHGSKVLDIGTVIRFVPMLFAAAYFGTNKKWILAVPIIAILSFITDPVGRSVWYFSLYWLIPIICYFFKERWLLARSLGATFMAHAVGGALWIHAFHLSRAVWISLIPIVALERLIFTCAMVVLYLATQNIVDYILSLERSWHEIYNS